MESHGRDLSRPEIAGKRPPDERERLIRYCPVWSEARFIGPGGWTRHRMTQFQAHDIAHALRIPFELVTNGDPHA